ncbi:RNA 2'-phosphotransferase [Roseibium salinum]|uniref:Probable RNA 2'-phosphotransferase n=1 Tax=Roseibium salinum TaxID=1604349 RepID=A0ABT3QXZ7_9HYPH|nr:RNA 2'-phosphotransferase [Roseibium sp. DSM 29163]MCX2721718.1 RNA 2'-phosphotransferase [Roseibium sp. DSM 29163]
MKTDISKRMSFWLRHRPEDAGIELTKDGWADVGELLRAFRETGLACRREHLERVVETNDKQRFEFSKDGTMIRARQGHSVRIDLGLEPSEPPARLFHGTAHRALPLILKEGLKPMNRHHVHLSSDFETAVKVGARHGKPVVLQIATCPMGLAGHVFYRTENGVWLTDAVPAKYLTPAPE